MPPGKPPAPPRPADLPSKTAAADQARSLFHSLGADIPVDALQVTDEITRWLVAADPGIGGLPTIGRSISVTIGPKASIVAASGFLGTPAKLGDYPLVDTSTVGFKRLLDAEAHRPRPMIAAYPCRADVANCGRTAHAPGHHHHRRPPRPATTRRQVGPDVRLRSRPNEPHHLSPRSPTPPTNQHADRANHPQTEPGPPQPPPGKAQPPTAGAAPAKP